LLLCDILQTNRHTIEKKKKKKKKKKEFRREGKIHDKLRMSRPRDKTTKTRTSSTTGTSGTRNLLDELIVAEIGWERRTAKSDRQSEAKMVCGL
jgi:hypothetical protein